MKELLKKCLVEFIGTFFLVFTIGCALFPNGRGGFPPMAIGFVLMVMIYAGGHVSGGHYNPAVSLAAAIRGALSWRDFVPYMIAQFLGGVSAAFLAAYIVAIPPYANETSFSMIPMIICEFLFTFALCYTVLHTATSEDTKGNSYFGLAIGSTVTVGIFAVGSVLCYGAFNPAVAMALGMMHTACWPSVFVTIVTNLIAGAIAALIYNYTNPDKIEINL